MAEHPNAVSLRKGYEAFLKGDIEALSTLIAEDAVWHNGGRNVLSGDYKGQSEIFGMFGKLAEMTGSSMTMEIHSVLADDEHAVALVHVTARRGDKSYSGDEAHVYHMSGGKVNEFWGLPVDAYGEDEFWS